MSLEDLFGDKKDHNSPDEATEEKIRQAIRSKGETRYDKELGVISYSLSGEESTAFMPKRLQMLEASYNSGHAVKITFDEAKEHSFNSFVKDDKHIKVQLHRVYSECTTGECTYVKYTREHPLILTKRSKESDALADKCWGTHEITEEQYNIERRKMEYNYEQKVLKFFDENNLWVIKEEMTHVYEIATEYGYKANHGIPHKHIHYHAPEHDGRIDTWVQLVHGYDGCKGTAVFAGPYHIVCSKCDTEVREWEWGIDYDTG